MILFPDFTEQNADSPSLKSSSPANGMIVGEMAFRISGQEIARVPLVVDEQEGFIQWLERFLNPVTEF
jgi:hypothetical protein